MLLPLLLVRSSSAPFPVLVLVVLLGLDGPAPFRVPHLGIGSLTGEDEEIETTNAVLFCHGRRKEGGTELKEKPRASRRQPPDVEIPLGILKKKKENENRKNEGRKKDCL